MFHRLKNKSCLDVFVRLYAHGMIPELQETRDSIGNQFIQFCRLRNLAVGREAKRRKRKTQPERTRSYCLVKNCPENDKQCCQIWLRLNRAREPGQREESTRP